MRTSRHQAARTAEEFGRGLLACQDYAVLFIVAYMSSPKPVIVRLPTGLLSGQLVGVFPADVGIQNVSAEN